MHSVSMSAFAVPLLLVFAAEPVGAQFESLATTVPSSANAVALFDVERLLTSPMAAKEDWKDKYDQAFAAGLCAIPPFTKSSRTRPPACARC